jgi:probable HAF family extracellular repeat protein
VANEVELIVSPDYLGTSGASHLDDAGDVVAGGISEIEYSWVFVRDAEGGWTDLAGDSGYNWVTGLSADGSVVSISSADTYGHNFAWVGSGDSGLVELGSLPGGNDNAQVYGLSADGLVAVGSSSMGQGDRAFRWTAQRGMRPLERLLPQLERSAAQAVNADGSVIVGYIGSGSQRAAFHWTEATGMVDLGFLHGTSTSRAHTISDDGTVVAGMSGDIPFLWTESLGMVPLVDHLLDLGVECLDGWTIKGVGGLSADGNAITGNATNPSGQTEAFVAYFHTPAGLAMGSAECSPATPNSTGNAGRLSVLGSSCVADETAELVASDLPAGNVCLFLAAANAGLYQPPGSCGPICLGGPDIARYKFDAQLVDANGECSLEVDPLVVLTDPPQPILAGQTWHFQAWHRDAGAQGGCNNNFTDAVAVEFR